MAKSRTNWATKATAKVDAYEAITNKILDALKQGKCPWQRPWNGGGAGYISYSTGRPYSLLNQILLLMDDKQPGEYLTFKQVKDAGGSVKKGAKSTTIYFWKRLHYESQATDENGQPEYDENGKPVMLEANPIYLKGYNVFSIADCEGVEPKHAGDFTPSDAQPIEAAQAIADNYYNAPGAPRLNVQFSGRAFYTPTTDMVVVPELKQYELAEEFYSTLFHESIHSTGHASRLGRIKADKVAAFGSEDYSREELVAEIGAAYLINRAGIDSEKAFNNSIAYLQGWSRHLANKPREFAIACAQAEKAANYILNANAANS